MHDHFPARATWLGLCLLLSLCHVPEASAREIRLRVDTVWQGVVELQDDVTVLPGVTLIVRPGTVIRVKRVWLEAEHRGLNLDVRGRLIAEGSSALPIRFSSAASDPRIGDWAGIVLFSGAELSLAHCRVEHADQAVRGSHARITLQSCQLRLNRLAVAGLVGLSGAVRDCEISENQVGIQLNGVDSLCLERCRIEANPQGGIRCVRSDPLVRGCRVLSNGPFGIACEQGASPRIQGNYIQGQKRGVQVRLFSSPSITHNEIVGNDTGLWAEQQVYFTAEHNRIAGNGVGVYCNMAGRPTLRNNDILDNRRFAVVLGDHLSSAAERDLPQRRPGEYRGAPRPDRMPPPTVQAPPPGMGITGAIDARENWWGRNATLEMAGRGPDSEISIFEDAHDKPEVLFLGPRGERTGKAYPRDKVLFRPWAEAPVARAGRGHLPEESRCPSDESVTGEP